MRRYIMLALIVLSAQSAAAQLASESTVQVLSPHWVALSFSPQYPAGRHTQNPLSVDGLRLPVPESLQIRGQAGQSSETQVNDGGYRVPVPDFVADAGVDRALLQATVQLRAQGTVVNLDATSHIRMDGAEVRTTSCPKQLCRIDYPLMAYEAEVKRPVNPAEFTLDFHVSPGEALGVRGGCEHIDIVLPQCILAPTLYLHTHDAIQKPAGWHSSEQSGLDMPAVTPLFDQFLRDTSIVLAPDGFYYMTGTTGGPEMMVVTSDLSVWKSPDLIQWRPVRDLPRQSTVVWNIDRDGSAWIKAITLRDGEPFRPLWAPEIHYINKTFWIPFSVPRHGVTLLKSTSGKAEGPYEVAIKPDKPLSTGIDASLFQDNDGSVYFLYGGGWIAKMKPDMSGLAESFRHIESASGREVGFEGVYLFRDRDRYYLCAADFVQGEYNTYISAATSLAGPWSERYLAVPHAGHANFFRDKEGRMWSTFFGNDRNSPVHAKPAIVPLMQDSKGRWHPDSTFKLPKPTTLTASQQAPGAIGPSDGQPQHVGVMPAVH